MANMTKAQKDTQVKELAVNAISPAFDDFANSLVQTGDYTYAMRFIVDNEERWAEVTVVAKNNKDTATTSAYDPYVKAEEWQEDKNEKAKKAKENAEKKEKKLKGKGKNGDVKIVVPAKKKEVSVENAVDDILGTDNEEKGE